MTPAQLYAMTACIAGVLLMLGWFYILAGNPRSDRLLLKSTMLFVLPGVALWALPDALFVFPLSLWALVAIEEALKTIAARKEPNQTDRFWLISLFGIWELILAKPMWGFANSELLSTWSSAQLVGLVVAGIVTVLMHCVTAAIYAFRFEHRLPVAFLASWSVHAAFNESVDLLGVSPFAAVMQAAVLLLLLVAVWPRTTNVAAAEGAHL